MSRQVRFRVVQSAGQGPTTQFQFAEQGQPQAVTSPSGMLIEQAIYKILKTTAGVTNLVVGRIFAGVMPQQNTTYPAIVYRTPPDGGRLMTEVLEGGCSLVRQRIHVFSAGRTYGQAALVDAAVGDALQEYHGTVYNTDASPQESIDIQSIFMTLMSHAHQYVDKTELHEFVTEFECYFIDPRRLTGIDE